VEQFIFCDEPIQINKPKSKAKFLDESILNEYQK
jgi:hypothetical protein